MQEKIETITINDVEYVRADLVNLKAQADDGGHPYVICRTHSAGVFAGYLKSREGKEVTLLRARRLWRWAGVASLSQLAVDGTSAPGDCRFPCEVDSVLLTEAIEIIDCTEKAKLSIAGVPVWKSIKIKSSAGDASGSGSALGFGTGAGFGEGSGDYTA